MTIWDLLMMGLWFALTGMVVAWECIELVIQLAVVAVILLVIHRYRYRPPEERP